MADEGGDNKGKKKKGGKNKNQGESQPAQQPVAAPPPGISSIDDFPSMGKGKKGGKQGGGPGQTGASTSTAQQPQQQQQQPQQQGQKQKDQQQQQQQSQKPKDPQQQQSQHQGQKGPQQEKQPNPQHQAAKGAHQVKPQQQYQEQQRPQQQPQEQPKSGGAWGTQPQPTQPQAVWGQMAQQSQPQQQQPQRQQPQQQQPQQQQPQQQEPQQKQPQQQKPPQQQQPQQKQRQQQEPQPHTQQQKPQPHTQQQTPQQMPRKPSVPGDDVAAKISGLGIQDQPKRSPSVASSVASSESSSRTAATLTTSAPMALAPHKGPGTKGRRVTIDVNYLALNLQKLVKKAYHYDVTIEPDKPKRFMPIAFEAFRKRNFPKTFIAYDGKKNAISPIVLKIDETIERKISIKDPDNAAERAYMVTIKEVKNTSEIDMNSLQTYSNTRQYDLPARAMQALEIVLKSVFLNMHGVQCGRSFYTTPSKENHYDLGDGYELWTGLFQSTVLGSRPFINVDIAHKAFPSAVPVMNIFQSLRNFSPNAELDNRSIDQLKSHLRGLRITYEMPGQKASTKCYKFNDFKQSALKLKFKDESMKEWTVFEYFKSRGYTIKFPYLPCLWVGNTVRNICLPPELCRISENQAVMKKCTENQTRNMIRVAATSTDVRKQKIMDILKKIDYNRCETLQQFGLSVASDFTAIPARILDPPTLEYAGNRQVMPKKGVWMASGGFLQAANVIKWSILCLDDRSNDNSINQFGKKLATMGCRTGMQFSTDFNIERLRAFCKDHEIDNVMQKLIKDNCQLLVCVIQDGGDSYARVKQAAELRCGILTQCLKAGTLFRKGNDDSTVSNILLKINAKLNGTNHKFHQSAKLPIMGRPFMVVGADVTHPSPDQRNIPSVVGVAASYDANAFRYNICWRLQDPKREMIVDMAAIIREQLLFFKEKNKRLPETIFYYRDGVSEGQFQEIMRTELVAMRQGCQDTEPNYQPKITFVVVQKRHHTRFFPGKSGISQDRNNNVPPGTIVDSEITHPNETQFFLVSHQSIQGVAKPTKYCLLVDENKMTMDDLETFTYNLCHLFTRCNRAVSYPAPTYYAHLVAYRGRVYIEDRSQIRMDKLDMEFKNRQIKDIIVKGHPMYFV